MLFCDIAQGSAKLRGVKPLLLSGQFNLAIDLTAMPSLTAVKESWMCFQICLSAKPFSHHLKIHLESLLSIIAHHYNVSQNQLTIYSTVQYVVTSVIDSQQHPMVMA